MYDKRAFDPVRDFAPIARVFIAANVLVVPNEVPARTLPELVALARAQPGKLTYAHDGADTSRHLAAELFKSMARLDIQPVAYRGTTALLPDLLAGRVTMAFGNVVNVLPLVREGKLRAFAVTSVKRSGIAPDRAAARPRGEITRFRGDFRQALGDRPGSAHDGRVRLSRIRGPCLGSGSWRPPGPRPRSSTTFTAKR